jgi:fatty-acyl-CoA synthase
VYPAELEQLLVGVPGVVESTIIGRADDRWGEVPIVVAVRDDETVVDDDLLAVFDGRVARYKAPKAVAWVDSLPRTAMGKVQKHLLRADLAG